MKKIGIIIVLFCITRIGFAADEQQLRLLAVSATSSSADSSPVICLLDPGCTGSWSPGALDSGTDEGIYLQFEKPFAAKHIKLVISQSGIRKTEKNNIESMWDDLLDTYDPFVFVPNIEVYINGKSGDPGKGYSLLSIKKQNTQQIGQVEAFVAVVGNPIRPISEKIKSVFIKINNGNYGRSIMATTFRISRIQFLSSDLSKKEPDHVIPVILPKIVPATISASSTLSPDTAYQPANLVDSKYDMAWSTDGKTTDGRGQFFTFNFAIPQTIAGMMLWNGYQRSDEHFKANGRVAQADVSGNDAQSERIVLRDAMGPQVISFKTPLSGVGRFTFKIADIKPGSKYRDVLISEIRFIDSNGRLILPAVAMKKVVASKGIQPLIDKSYASVLHAPIGMGNTDSENYVRCELSAVCNNSHIRLRNNGTYVVYKDFDYVQGRAKNKETYSTVLEGNWEPIGDEIRIFGRQYRTVVKFSEYEIENKESRTTIFQSNMGIKPYNALASDEKKKLYEYLWAKMKGPLKRNQKFVWYVGDETGCGSKSETEILISDVGCPVFGSNYTDLIQKMDKELSRLNPYWITSSVLSGLFLPTDNIFACVPELYD